VSYPLTIRFKVLAIARQLSVEDGSGRLLMYIKQKAFKLREAITVFADEAQTRPLYRINADRIIDWSAKYTITDESGQEMGAIRQQGMRSLWRTRYDILRGGENVVFQVQEENPWAKVGDHFLGEIPILGFFAGYLFHPKYVVKKDGVDVLRATKQPAFFEGRFKVDRLEAPLSAEDERLLVIGAVTVVLLEKNRG
jgi:uncharacterized protein YxjI